MNGFSGKAVRLRLNLVQHIPFPSGSSERVRPYLALPWRSLPSGPGGDLRVFKPRMDAREARQRLHLAAGEGVCATGGPKPLAVLASSRRQLASCSP